MFICDIFFVQVIWEYFLMWLLTISSKVTGFHVAPLFYVCILIIVEHIYPSLYKTQPSNETIIPGLMLKV